MKIRKAKLISFLTGLFFPPVCPGCGRSIAAGDIFCPDCAGRLERPAAGELCPRCGKQRCVCEKMQPAFTRTYPAAYYAESMAQAVQNLKFNHNPGLARTLAPLLAQTLREYDVGQADYDLLAAAPMSRKRYKKRGYNQAALLAAETAKLCGIPFRPDAVVKVKETRAQHDLSAAERRVNLNGSFRGGQEVAGKRVLLCDDVMTTGSTANEAAQAMLLAGAERVDVLVLSVTRMQMLENG